MYAVDDAEAEIINKRRRFFIEAWEQHTTDEDFEEFQPKGNFVRRGDVFPVIITQIHQNHWGDDWKPPETFNGQLMLDGPDTHWIECGMIFKLVDV